MKFIRNFILIFAVMFVSIGNIEAQILEPSVIVTKMENHFRNIEGFAASFVEKNGSDIYTGTLIYKKPGKFKMTYLTPERKVKQGEDNYQTIAFNGENIWIYLPRAGLVTEQKIDTNATVGAFYTKEGVDRLSSDYNFNFYKNRRELRPINRFDDSELGFAGYNASHAASDGRMAYHMELTPKTTSTDQTGFVKIHLWVGNDGMILRALGISTTQSIIEYLFTSINYKEIYADDAFNFVIPQGMLVLKDKLVR